MTATVFLPVQKEADRLALEVKVRGKGCPPVVGTWEQCGFSERVLAVIRRNHFVVSRPLPRCVVCDRPEGRRVLVVADSLDQSCIK